MWMVLIFYWQMVLKWILKIVMVPHLFWQQLIVVLQSEHPTPIPTYTLPPHSCHKPRMPHTCTSVVILSPLSFLWNVALRIGGDRCVQLLLKHGAKPDAKDHVGVTALIAAAYNGHTECVTVLLENGAMLDARSHGGVTPLIAAAEGCNALCTRLLIQVKTLTAPFLIVGAFSVV
jgi:hypothetical protein